MKYLRVKNFHKFQHDSSKALPWVKFFTALLSPTKEVWYSELPDAQKALLHHIWLMARVFNNRIPEDWLTKERLNLKSRVSLDKLIDEGAIWFESEDGTILSSSRTRDARSDTLDSQVLALKEPPEINQNLEFERLWAEYPKPIGKKQAFTHFCASVTSAEDLAAIQRALDAYKTHCAATEDRFIQHGKTWFNNWRDWLVVGPRLVKGPDGLVIPEATVRDRFLDGPLDCYAAEHGRRPNEEPARGEWDARFEAYFGFTPDQFKAGEVTDSQMAEWLRVRA